MNEQLKSALIYLKMALSAANMYANRLGNGQLLPREEARMRCNVLDRLNELVPDWESALEIKFRVVRRLGGEKLEADLTELSAVERLGELV